MWSYDDDVCFVCQMLWRWNTLFNVCFDGGRLAGEFGAMPFTRTPRVIILRWAEALALTQHTAAALVRFSRAWGETHAEYLCLTESLRTLTFIAAGRIGKYWPGWRHTRQWVTFFTTTSDLSERSDPHSLNLQHTIYHYHPHMTS